MTDLDILNEALADKDDWLTRGFAAPRLPVSFVFSQPRAGSTLFQQLMLSSMTMGYVSNLLARLWRAPYLGAVLDMSLRDPTYVSHFRSRYGIAEGAQEPHEWGWFWRHRLGLRPGESYCSAPSAVDVDGLGRKLGALEAALAAPLIFDNVYAMNNFEVVARSVSAPLAIYLHRDPYFVCNSLINARLERHGDIAAFYGNEPRDWPRIERIADPVERIVAQVRATAGDIDARLAALPESRILRIEYGDLIAAPWRVLDRFAGFLRDNGAVVERRPNPPQVALRSRDTPAAVNPLYKEALDRHFRAYFG